MSWTVAGPELITSCKETQLTRLQCRVEQLATQPRRHSLKIINLCKYYWGVRSEDNQNYPHRKIKEKLPKTK